MDFIKDNWTWIIENIWRIFTLASIFFAAGWSAAALFYSERIELLKERSKEIKSPDSIENEFVYPDFGKTGKNILSSSTLSIAQNETVSLKAIIPQNKKLLIELNGPKIKHKQDTDTSWVFPVSGKRNWTTKIYESEKGGVQEFDAETGIADMELKFQRAGELIITVVELGKPSNTWVKTLMIK